MRITASVAVSRSFVLSASVFIKLGRSRTRWIVKKGGGGKDRGVELLCKQIDGGEVIRKTGRRSISLCRCEAD